MGPRGLPQAAFRNNLQVPVAFIDQLDRAEEETAFIKQPSFHFARFMGFLCG